MTYHALYTICYLPYTTYYMLHTILGSFCLYTKCYIPHAKYHTIYHVRIPIFMWSFEPLLREMLQGVGPTLEGHLWRCGICDASGFMLGFIKLQHGCRMNSAGSLLSLVLSWSTGILSGFYCRCPSSSHLHLDSGPPNYPKSWPRYPVS